MWGKALGRITQKEGGVFLKGGEVLTPLQTTDYFTKFVVQVRKIKTLQKGKQWKLFCNIILGITNYINLYLYWQRSSGEGFPLKWG